MVREVIQRSYVAQPYDEIPVAGDEHLASAPVKEWTEAIVEQSGLSSREVPRLGTYYEGLRERVDMRVRSAVGLCSRAGQCSVQAMLKPSNPDLVSEGELLLGCSQRTFSTRESAEEAERDCFSHYAGAPERVANMIREDLTKLTAPVAEA